MKIIRNLVKNPLVSWFLKMYAFGVLGAGFLFYVLTAMDVYFGHDLVFPATIGFMGMYVIFFGGI